MILQAAPSISAAKEVKGVGSGGSPAGRGGGLKGPGRHTAKQKRTNTFEATTESADKRN